MKRKNQLLMGLALMVVFISVAFLVGCSKKEAIRNETFASGQVPAKTVTGDKTSGESALREKELREKAFREQTLRDQAARGKVPESARRGSAEKEGAIPKRSKSQISILITTHTTLSPRARRFLRRAHRHI